MATPKLYLRCPCCGKSGERSAFVQGALGSYGLRALQLRHVTKGMGLRADGSRGGAVVWQRRPMNLDEIDLVGKALTSAYQQIADRDVEITPATPEEVLGSLDDLEAEAEARAWLAEAERELARRRQVVQEDQERRAQARW